eukprot:scaffold374052_cov31-Attheya_sp.AAC.1
MWPITWKCLRTFDLRRQSNAAVPTNQKGQRSPGTHHPSSYGRRYPTPAGTTGSRLPVGIQCCAYAVPAIVNDKNNDKASV